MPLELNLTDVFRLQALRALLDLELDLGTFIQGTIAVVLDGRKVNEHVIAAGTLDESIALGGVKPLHNTFFFHLHFSSSLFVVLLVIPDKESGLSRLAKN
jgi:hypothetical protein